MRSLKNDVVKKAEKLDSIGYKEYLVPDEERTGIGSGKDDTRS